MAWPPKRRLTTKSARHLAGYPLQKKTGVIIRKRGGIKSKGLIRQPRPRISARRPIGVATRQIKRWALEERAATVTIAPAGSLEERIFYQALVDHGFIPGVDFDYQSQMFGGRAELGGLVADFLFPIPKVIVNPYSDWHTMSEYNLRRDLDQITILESMGYTVLIIWPVTIYDQAALDDWIARYIRPLWGTSYNGGQSSFTGRDDAYGFTIQLDERLVKLEAKLEEVLILLDH